MGIGSVMQGNIPEFASNYTPARGKIAYRFVKTNQGEWGIFVYIAILTIAVGIRI